MNYLKKIIKTCWGYVNLLKFLIAKTQVILNSEVVFFLPYYHIGGAEQVHLDIVRAIKNKKTTIIFTHLSATQHFLSRFREHSSIIELNSIINKKSPYVNRFLFKIIAHTINRSNVTSHIMGCNTTYFYDILPLLDDSKNRIDLIHAIAPSDSMIRPLAESASYIDTRIVINNKARIDLCQIYKEFNLLGFNKNIKVISNGVDLSAVRKLSKKSKVKINVGFIGRWSDEKRPWLFLKIAQMFESKTAHISFVMAGSGMTPYKDRIENSNTVSLGAIKSKEDLHQFYSTLDVIIICSSTEGFPMVLMEAMPFGVIPLCTDVGGISEHITSYNNGILIDKTEEDKIVQAFTDALLELWKKPSQKQKLSQKSKEYAYAHFGIEKFNKSYQSIFS
ncbi:glycosyltransferase family 4 protein [Dokdonia sp. LLG6352-1]|uniref:glycosyltransferase family 4 protein n=1 Tax=Dokdonia sp. LLG6352-1 TaxID=3160831 RepID=UPI00386D9583